MQNRRRGYAAVETGVHEQSGCSDSWDWNKFELYNGFVLTRHVIVIVGNTNYTLLIRIFISNYCLRCFIVCFLKVVKYTVMTQEKPSVIDHITVVLIPNRTFLVRFGGISGEFGRAMVRILARRSRAKIPRARPNEPDMPPKRSKKVRLGIYRTQIQNLAKNLGTPTSFSLNVSVLVVKHRAIGERAGGKVLLLLRPVNTS